MYLVIELQTNGDTMANLAWAYSSKEQAEQKYHTVLAAAAVSTVETHTALIMNAEGTVIKRETYKHMSEG